MVKRVTNVRTATRPFPGADPRPTRRPRRLGAHRAALNTYLSTLRRNSLADVTADTVRASDVLSLTATPR